MSIWPMVLPFPITKNTTTWVGFFSRLLIQTSVKEPCSGQWFESLWDGIMGQVSVCHKSTLIGSIVNVFRLWRRYSYECIIDLCFKCLFNKKKISNATQIWLIYSNPLSTEYIKYTILPYRYALLFRWLCHFYFKHIFFKHYGKKIEFFS